MRSRTLTLFPDEFAGTAPTRHPAAEPFWHRLESDRVFTVARCLDCGTTRFPLSPGCHECLSLSHEWTEVETSGTISAVTRIERVTSGASWAGATPYLVALVDVLPAMRLPGRLLCSCDVTHVHGTPVDMCLLPTEDGGVVFAFVHSCHDSTEGETSDVD